jgi:hypothetical protein
MWVGFSSMICKTTSKCTKQPNWRRRRRRRRSSSSSKFGCLFVCIYTKIYTLRSNLELG